MAWYWWTIVITGGIGVYCLALIGLCQLVFGLGGDPRPVLPISSCTIPPVVLDRLDIEPQMTIGEQLAVERKYVVTEDFLFDVLSVAARIVAASQVPDGVAGDPQMASFLNQERLRTIHILLTVAGGTKALLDYDASPEVQRRYMERMKAVCVGRKA